MMPFDINTARPAQSFDISTAQPIKTSAVEAALKIGGDTGETQDPDVDPHLIEYVAAVPEVAKTLAAGATVGTLGYAGGFIEGLLREMQRGEFGTHEAAKRIEQTALERSSGFTGLFAPESEAGQRMLEGIGEVAEDLPAVGAALAPFGHQIQAASLAAKAAAPMLKAKMGGQSLLIDHTTGLPTKPLAKALNKRDAKFSLILEDPKSLPVLSNKRSADDIVDAVITKRIKQGSGNESLAGLRLEGKKVVPDDLGIEAVRQGYRPGDVASAKNSSQSTRNKMVEMLKIKRRIQGDSSVALEIRPSKIAGDELMKRFNVVKNKALELRNELNRIAEGEVGDERALPGPGVRQGLKGLEVDTSSIENSVLDGLRKINIDIPDDIAADTTRLADHLRSKGAFIGSDISKDRTSQRVIRDTVDLLAEPGSADALRAHRVKRQIDKMVDFRTKDSGGLTEPGERFAKSIRRSLNDSIREVNDQYANVNDDLSKALNSMNSIKDSMPRKVNLFGEGAEEAVGQELRKLLSNYASRQELRNAIKEIDDTSKFFGGDFDTDVNKLVQFNNTLDDRFGATARGSFKGEIESGLRTLSPKQMVVEKLSDKVLDAINNLKGVNDEKAFNSMQELLKRAK